MSTLRCELLSGRTFAQRATVRGAPIPQRPPRPPIAAFLLDLDGVLVRSHEAHVQAYLRAFRAHDLTLSPLAAEMVEGGVAREAVMAAASVPPELVDAVSDAKEAAFVDLVVQGRVVLLEGARSFLETLRSKKPKVALVSNSATAKLCVDALDLGWAFDTVVDGTMVARGKPAPDLYRLAADLLDVSPALCVAVEDSPPGAMAARTAGAFVVGVGDLVDDTHVDAHYPDVSDIPLEEWLSHPPAPSGPQVSS